MPAQHQIFAVEQVPAVDGQLLACEALVVLLQVFFILHIAVAGISDGRYAQSQERQRVAVGVTHEVAVQAPGMGRVPQAVGRQGEMIEADFPVARLLEALTPAFIERALRRPFGHVGIREAALSGFDPGHVSVAVEGDAIGAQAADRVHRQLDAGQSLERQPIDQVEIHAGEAHRACLLGDGLHLRHALHAVDDVLHLRIEVLDAETDAAEALRSKQT